MGGLGPHPYAAAKAAWWASPATSPPSSGAFGIRVNAIAPGKVATPLTAGLVQGDPDDIDGVTAYLREPSPLFQRPGLAEDIGQAVAWLASDRAGYISGHTLVVDGGWTTGSPQKPRKGRGQPLRHQPAVDRSRRSHDHHERRLLTWRSTTSSSSGRVLPA